MPEIFISKNLPLRMKFFLALGVVFIYLIGCQGNSETTDAVNLPASQLINYSVKKFFPHDTNLYTEGFLVHNGQLFESTGSPDDLPLTKSLFGIVDLQTGKLDVKKEIERKKYFGEGIVILNNKLYQLTYTNQVGFIYDATSFKQLGQFAYANEQGWALTTNGKDIIMSDGTDKLTFLDSGSLKPVKTLAVTENGIPVEKLNELEYINGFIYANVFLTNFIVKIDPANGKVVGRLDFTSIAFEAKNKKPDADVLNGIAYDAAADKIYITGKLWPNIYQVEFSH